MIEIGDEEVHGSYGGGPTMTERGAAYMPIVKAAHKRPTSVSRILARNASRLTIITPPRNAIFNAPTNFIDFTYITSQITLVFLKKKKKN